MLVPSRIQQQAAEAPATARVTSLAAAQAPTLTSALGAVLAAALLVASVVAAVPARAAELPEAAALTEAAATALPETATATIPETAHLPEATALTTDTSTTLPDATAELPESSALPAAAAPEPMATSYSDTVLTIGSDESRRNVTWYTDQDSAQVLQYAVATGAKFPTSGVTTVPATGGSTTSGEFNRRAEISGLSENTSYVYRVGSAAAGWSPVRAFSTGAFSGDYEFLFFGDPQIGASGNVVNDGEGWADTLNVAMAKYPNSELLFSAGDQVQKAGDEENYQYFLAPKQLTSIPTVPLIGNHDVGSRAFAQHFTVPNLDENAGAASSDSASGGDYWFTYKDVLYVVLNSNSSDYASHIDFMQRIVAEHGDEAKWKVLAFHHSIYSVAYHVNRSPVTSLREAFPKAISEAGFDLVLQGHDHSYTRTYLVKDGELANASEVPGQAEVAARSGEVLYITANSASGSKYYNVKAPDAWYASVINQEKVRNYTHLSITDDALTITTLRSEANGSKSPVNSVVDEVTLTRAGAPVDPPGPTPLPDPSGNLFFLDNISDTVARTAMKVTTADQVLSGDWDDDGVDTPVLRRGTTYTFLASNRTGAAETSVELGAGVPVVGDFNGDGKDDIAIRRPKSNLFDVTYNRKGVIPAGVVDTSISYGKATDAPLAGNWSGAGRDSIGVKRGNTFFLKNNLSSGSKTTTFVFGRPDDLPIVGDFNGDGKDSIAVIRGNIIFVKNSLTGGGADRNVSLGRKGDALLSGDWFGQGSDTFALYRR
ncbi:MAG: metallophosphoesterase family protein [Ancrocorticia sp.]